ncbi:hypothetical protein VTO73DRAFT_14415 [Trametes versicolor]
MAMSMRVNFTSLLPSSSGCAQSIYAHPSSSQGPKTPTGLISHNPKPSSWEPPVHNNRKRPRSEAFHTSEDCRDSKRAKAEAPVLQATALVSSLYEAPVSPKNDTKQEPSSSGWANNFFDDDPWLADLASPNERRFLPLAAYEGLDAWTGDAVQHSSNGVESVNSEPAFEYASSSNAGNTSFAEEMNSYPSTSSVEYIDLYDGLADTFVQSYTKSVISEFWRRTRITGVAPARPRTLADRQRLKTSYRPARPSPLGYEEPEEIDLESWFTMSQDDLYILANVDRALGGRV